MVTKLTTTEKAGAIRRRELGATERHYLPYVIVGASLLVAGLLIVALGAGTKVGSRDIVGTALILVSVTGLGVALLHWFERGQKAMRAYLDSLVEPEDEDLAK